MKLKIFIFAFVIILLVMQINFVSASISLGNLSHDIISTYSISNPLRGWINISLDRESAQSLISAFGKNITIKAFLDNNRLDCRFADECSCSPTDCLSTYSTIGGASSQKNYSLNSISTKLFGIRITNNISQISDFKFNISTNAQSSCLNPLMIDVLDNGIDWKVEEVNNEVCFIKSPSGCYNSSYSSQGESIQIGTEHLCQKIIVPSAGGFKIGAKINGSGAETFSLTIEAGGVGKTCTTSVNSNINSSLTISCNVSLKGLQGETEADVCVFSNRQTNYKIKFEDNQPCGYVLQANGERFLHDFDIFAFPLKYSPPPNFLFSNRIYDDETNLTQLIFNYVERRYNKECNPECIIPIRIYSGTSQNLKISDLLIDYNVRGLATRETNFYDIDESPALISSDFLKLDLEKANLTTPNGTGIAEIIISIGNRTIIEEISIINVPQVKKVLPVQAALLVPTTFTAILEFPARNLTYTWNFGDNTLPIKTNENKIEHTYTISGAYQIIVNVSNERGQTSKSFPINILATYNAINLTIKEHKKKLENINNDLAVIPDWIKNIIEQNENIEDLNSQVNRLERDFKESFQEDFVKLMSDLINLDIPYKLDTSLVVKETKFFQNKDRLDVSVLEQDFDAGKVEFDNGKYYNSINNWLSENLDVNFESKAYSFYYNEEEDEEKVLLSHVKLILTPKKDIEEFYIVIEGDKSKIKFKEDYSEKELSNGYGIRFTILPADEKKEIEFSYPETIDHLNLPVYLSPEFRKLNLVPAGLKCNNNNICEKELGENYKDCRADCKPWKFVGFLLGFLLLIAFVIYIILQEWYKKRYESHLFKDKNQLFNLITFMHTSINHKLLREQIFDKLKPLGWSKEQLIYAWDKLHGKRTGMWEIPIFRLFEKASLKKEIEKRQTSIVSKNINPIFQKRI